MVLWCDPCLLRVRWIDTGGNFWDILSTLECALHLYILPPWYSFPATGPMWWHIQDIVDPLPPKHMLNHLTVTSPQLLPCQPQQADRWAHRDCNAWCAGLPGPHLWCLCQWQRVLPPSELRAPDAEEASDTGSSGRWTGLEEEPAGNSALQWGVWISKYYLGSLPKGQEWYKTVQ